jgi:hypothetical protein
MVALGDLGSDARLGRRVRVAYVAVRGHRELADRPHKDVVVAYDFRCHDYG